MRQQGPHRREPHTRLRRAHRKSRKGCTECKVRHIKCDEGRPRCANCATVDRVCSFLTTHRSPPCEPMDKAEETKFEQAKIQADFTAIHLACLHHAAGSMEDYMALQETVRPIIDIAINNANTAPYLLDQLLALSALHLSTKDLSTEALYHREATELQTRALGLFNQARKEVSDNNQIHMFLFASLLGIHTLRETLRNRRDNLPEFIDAFIQYVHLHRGVRTVINKSSWVAILHSDLKPLLYVANLTQDMENVTPGIETTKLSELLESSGLEPASISACQSALKWMQWVLDICRLHPSRDDLGIHATMAWPLFIPQEYVELLHQNQFEALAVLTFYGAALHRYRRYWVFGEAGSFLVQLILNSVGPVWHDHLAWPTQFISEI